MPHPTCYGIAQETEALSLLAASDQKDLEKRGVTADKLTEYKTLTQAMEDAV
jgi:predicted RecB family nuclease